jgi:hypothetical protein
MVRTNLLYLCSADHQMLHSIFIYLVECLSNGMRLITNGMEKTFSGRIFAQGWNSDSNCVKTFTSNNNNSADSIPPSFDIPYGKCGMQLENVRL